MYFQITTRCNMHCAHCCFSCGNDGEDMPYSMYREILDRWGRYIKAANTYVVIGGGEPTLHPDFWEILTYSMGYGKPWLATNGSNKDVALTLCRMARNGYIGAVLSIDEWHDPISPEVISAYKIGMKKESCEYYEYWRNPDDKTDGREIRTVIYPYEGGRSRGMEKVRRGCPCPGLQFRPTGSIYSCGCDDAPQIGTVEKGIQELQYKYYDIFTGCFRNINGVYNGI